MSWTEEELARLRVMIESGASPARASVVFRRTLLSVQNQARKLGTPFPRAPRRQARTPRKIRGRRTRAAERPLKRFRNRAVSPLEERFIHHAIGLVQTQLRENHDQNHFRGGVRARAVDFIRAGAIAERRQPAPAAKSGATLNTDGAGTTGPGASGGAMIKSNGATTGAAAGASAGGGTSSSAAGANGTTSPQGMTGPAGQNTK